MNILETLRELIDSLVIPDRKSAAGNVHREATLRTLQFLMDGERNLIPDLVAMLTEPGKGDDSKARYALHALAVQVGGGKNETAKNTLSQALAGTLKEKRPADVRRFVVRQLQVAGGKELVEALGKLLSDEEVNEEATQALLAIKAGAPEQFRAALPKALGQARRTIVQALGTLRDREAVKALLELVKDEDREVRVTALWSLANIGDPACLDVLIRASGSEGYERIKATSACLLLAERLKAAGKKPEAIRLYTHLRDTRTDASEKHIHDAAVRGLASVNR